MEIDKPYYLSASVICADMLRLESEIKAVEKGGIDFLHYDVMDGQFVPRLGLHPETLKQIKAVSRLPVDVHLMINDPGQFVPAFVEAGGDIITVHAESTPHLHRVIKQIKDLGAKAGVALNPGTPLSVLDYVLEDLDLVLIMAINPGIVGHKLIPEMLKKIADAHELLKKRGLDKKILLEVDGGVTFDSTPDMLGRGANMFVCGTSTIFKPPHPVETKINDLRKVLA